MLPARGAEHAAGSRRIGHAPHKLCEEHSTRPDALQQTAASPQQSPLRPSSAAFAAISMAETKVFVRGVDFTLADAIEVQRHFETSGHVSVDEVQIDHQPHGCCVIGDSDSTML